MAEALAVIGIVANILQLVDFTSKVLHRLDEFQSTYGEVPKSLSHIKAELPLLSRTLQEAKVAIDQGLINEERTAPLLPVFEGCEGQIKELEKILDKVLPNQQDSRARKVLKSWHSVRQDDKIERIAKNLQRYINTLTFYYTTLPSTLQPLIGTKIKEINQWLAAPDPLDNYRKALKLRQPGTGTWFTESDQYAQWKIHPFLIWLHGIPGCGKTILSSTILEDLFQYKGNDCGKVIIYFYFDFNDREKQDYKFMLQSLISQLLRQGFKIPTELSALFTSCENGRRKPLLDDLLKVFHQLIEEYPHVFIVLDALDECLERGELMSIIQQIVAWQLYGLHVLVTSRRERDIENYLSRLALPDNIVCIQSHLVDIDIQAYVKQRLSDDDSLQKWNCNAPISQEIESALMKGACGMFRWAVCQLDILGKCRTRSQLRKALADLPPTLDETYNRILGAIDKSDAGYAIRILRWLAFSLRPLKLSEVAVAAAIDLERSPAFDPEDVLEDPRDVLDICSSLITITQDNSELDYTDRDELVESTVIFAHYSVKEYLISDRIIKSKAALFATEASMCHSFIAKSCLQYLLQFNLSKPLHEGNSKDFPLAEYSAQKWITHAQTMADKDRILTSLILDFFAAGNEAYFTWLQIYKNNKLPPDPGFKLNKSDYISPIYCAAGSGFFEATRQLLDQGADVNAIRGAGFSSLYIASANGYEQIVRLLLDKGAEVNAGGGGYSSLYIASANGHEQIVRLLLDKGADINVGGGGYGPLYIASANGYEQIVKLLLDKGADVNAGGEWRGNPLYIASANGYEQIVKLLLDKGAEVNAIGGAGFSSLYIASANGHEQIVRLLLDKGAEVNAGGGRCSSLYEASAHGYEQIVKLLLDRGADVNAETYNGSPIYLASKSGHEQIVKLLLDKGADINAGGLWTNYSEDGSWTRDKKWDNPLKVASMEGHEQIVKLLLDRGADPSHLSSSRKNHKIKLFTKPSRSNSNAMYLLNEYLSSM